MEHIILEEQYRRTRNSNSSVPELFFDQSNSISVWEVRSKLQ